MKTNQDISPEVARLLTETDDLLRKAKAHLVDQGVDVSDLVEWLTVEEYCEKFEIERPEIITSYIEQGIIPETNVRRREDFPGKILIRALPHQINQPSD